jgi:hypothetical protein
MNKRVLIITGILVCILIVASSRLQIAHGQGESTISTNTSPISPSGDVDSDGDGFTDAQEIAWNTDPHDPNSHPDLTTDMVGWWPLDEGSGTQVADVSGSGLSGSLAGTQPPTWSTDLSGTSLTFYGSNGEIVVADTAALRPTNVFTLVTWVRTSDQEGLLIGKGTAEGQQWGYALMVHGGKLAARVTLGETEWPFYGHIPVSDGQWHHVACVYDGFEFRLVVDGQRDATTHLLGAVAPGDGSLVIGQLNGSLRDVGLYRRAFTSGKLKLMYEVVSTASTQLTKREPTTPTFLVELRHRDQPVQTARAESKKDVAR